MRLRARKVGWVLSLVAGAWLGCQALSAQPASSTNGVGRGYVGSSRWFEQLRSSAAQRAAANRALEQRRDKPKPSPETVEVQGRITFPGGNPFPRGRLPYLKAWCRNPQIDAVERQIFVQDDGSFHTVLARGQSYLFAWETFTGGRDEPFCNLTIRPTGPSVRTVTIPYAPSSKRTTARPEPVAPDDSGTSAHRPGPAEGSGEKPPAVGSGYQRPSVGPGYVPPGSR